jgi:glycosyltransferase involved in cell wall biosynthesis
LTDSAAASPDDPRILGRHPNVWDSWLYANTMARMGWTVDVINWNDRLFLPSHSYDAIVALDGNGIRLAEVVDGAKSRLILHLTTADPQFNNAAERGRLANLFHRRGVRLLPRRQLEYVAETHQAITSAHSCFLIGNSWTRSTYPESQQTKFSMTNVANSARTLPTDSEIAAKPLGNEYLWFFGGGAVHKGLDLALEAFATRHDLQLHVVGNLEAERDFLFEYQRELFRTTNIKYHGFLRLDSQALRHVMHTSTYLIAPSCSEGMSSAVAVAAANGLVPILTPEVGIDFDLLPNFQIASPTPDSLGAAIEESTGVQKHDRHELARNAATCARGQFSRDAYRARLEEFLTSALGDL